MYSQRSRQPPSNLSAIYGRQLWQQCFTDVIELTENHRQSDTGWASALERWRINQPTQRDIDEINSRVLHNNVSENQPLPQPGTIVAVSNNNTRENALHYAERNVISDLPPIYDGDTNWRHRGVLLVQATISAGPNGVLTDYANNIRKLSTKKIGFPGNLFCINGAPYLVSNNVDVANGVANGTLSWLYDVVLKPTAEIRIVTVDDDIQVHAVYADEVHCIVFKHKLEAWSATAAFPSLPSGCFPITAISKTVNFRDRGSQKRVKITQFPCVLSSVLTGHKVQGISVDSIILGSMSSHHRYGATGWLYVVLSRVRHLQGLFLLEPVESDPRKYKPRRDVIDEMTRFRLLQDKTQQRIDHLRCNSTI